MPKKGSTVSTNHAPRHRTLRIEPSPRTIIALVLLIAGVWVLTQLLTVVLVLVASLTIVGTISPAVRWLEEHGISRGMGITMVFTTLVAATVLITILTVPSLVSQATDLLDQEPVLRTGLVKWLLGSHLTTPLADMLHTVRSGDLARMAATNALTFSTRAIKIIAYILSSLFLALYITIDRDRLRGGLFLLVPRTHHIRLSRVILNLETIVGGYVRGQIITSAFMAAFVFLLLTACGAPNALAIAVLAGAADVLPYVGALISVGAAVAAVLSLKPAIIIIVLVLMLLYEEFESRVIIPRIYGRALRLPSSVILISLLAGGVLLGIVGALLAIPVAAAALMLVEELRVELPGQQEQAEDVEIRERDDRGEEEYERRAEGMPAEQAAAIAVEITTERHNEENKADIPGSEERGHPSI
ncbi:MAG: AI-2E family transporter [Desulfuromonadaceae bacterium]|nr:AI-2E family transporter [Desulfuromonadaceae bacterium]